MSLINSLKKPTLESKPLWDIVHGIIAYPAVVVSFDLKLYEKLSKEALGFNEIAVILSLAPRPLEAILAVNTSLGLIEFQEEKYSLTELSKAYLLPESHTNLCSVFSILSEAPFASTIESLREAVLSNKAQTYGGDDIFKSHEEATDKAKSFTRAMHSISMAPAFYWPEKIDLSQYKTFLDVAGGSGAHSLGLLKQWAHMSAIVFDIAPVCEVADEFTAQYQLQDRMSTCSGDMWVSEFPTAEVHFYSQIFHDWYFEKCEFLAQKSFESLPSGGTILIHEILYDEDKTASFAAAAASTAMLRWTEGKQYSFKELSHMLAKAGFTQIKETKTGFDDWSLVQGVKP